MTEYLLPPGGSLYSAAAIRRLRRLDSAARGLLGAAVDLGERRRSLLDERQRCERVIRDLEAEIGDARGAFVIHRDTDRASADRYGPDMRRAIERERERLRLIQAELEQLEARDRREAPLRQTIVLFADRLCAAAAFDRRVIAQAGVLPTTIIAAGDARRARLDELQAQLAALKAELASTAGARLHEDEVFERATAEIRALVGGSRSDLLVDRLTRHGSSTGCVFGPTGSDAEALRRQLALIVTLIGDVDVVAERLAVRALASPNYSPGLRAADRATRIRELEQRVAAIERDEELEALQLEAADYGCLVVRRHVEQLNLPMIVGLWSEEIRASSVSPARQLRE